VTGSGRRLTVAYLTNVYARATDTFIRGEVQELRRLGHRVVTYSVRRPSPSELVSADIRAEHDATTYLIDAGPVGLLAAGLRRAVKHPRRLLEAARLAARTTIPGARGRLWPLFYLLEACVLADNLEREGVDHLHDHIGEGSAAVAMLASVLSGIPYSFTVHGTEWDHPENLALELKVAHAAFVIGISEFTRSQIMRWSRTEDWPKVHMVGCGVSLDVFEPGFVTPVPDNSRIVSVGRLSPEKGLLVLIDAVAVLVAAGDSIQLQIVGEGPEREALQKRVAELGVANHVEFLGWATAPEVRDHIRGARALVMTSFAEGLPLVIMEALALGRPVVTTRVGAIAELVETGKCGWVVAPGSVEEVAAALRAVLGAPVDELEVLGAEGSRRVAVSHDPRTEAAKLANLMLGDPTDAASA
jgi:colanic acid/amylovoran biosynthesis glycosyltransferase